MIYSILVFVAGAAGASGPMRRGGGFLPDAAWPGAFVVVCRRMYCARIASVGGCQVSEMWNKMWRIEDE